MPSSAWSTATTEPSSLYLHTPFCLVKCGYCDFNSYARTPRSPVDGFLDAFATELARAPAALIPETIFLGGGTPTELEPAELERLLESLRDAVSLLRPNASRSPIRDIL